MKIHWLNAEMTEAIVERGWWRWKRRAMVKQCHPSGAWRYQPSGRIVGHEDGANGIEVAIKLNETRDAAIERRRKCHPDDWQPVRALPSAKVVGK